MIKVPKHAILSVETTAIANILQDEEIEGYIGLTLGCMYEASRGAASPWFAYLSLLAKRPAKMATSLPQNARDMMKSCEAYADIESDIVSAAAPGTKNKKMKAGDRQHQMPSYLTFF